MSLMNFWRVCCLNRDQIVLASCGLGIGEPTTAITETTCQPKEPKYTITLCVCVVRLKSKVGKVFVGQTFLRCNRAFDVK